MAVFAPVTVYTLNAAIAHVQSCDSEVTLTVAAAPEIAGVLEDFVEAGGGAPERGSDVCAEIEIASVESGEIGGTEADVWIPETSMWLDFPESELAEQWGVVSASTASSPVGLALPAGEDPGSIDPTEAEVAIEDPRRNPADLLWITIFGVGDNIAASGSPVMSAHQVRAHNAESGDELQAPSAAAQVGQFQYPMLTAADIGDDRREAAQNLVRSYGLPEYTELLTDAGFGPPAPAAAERDESAVPTALDAWDAYSSSNLAWLSTSLRIGCASDSARPASTEATADTCSTCSPVETNTLSDAFHSPAGSRTENPMSPFS